MTKATTFTEAEATICTTAKMIQKEHDKSYWVGGGGTPLASALMAQRVYVPNLTLILEDGVIAPQPAIPLDSWMVFVAAKPNYRANAWTSMNTVCSHASVGLFDYGILLSLQTDPYGNINSSFLGGDFYHPKRRYGGAGGANEIASLCWHTILHCPQEKRKFVKKIDFITSPGFLDGSPHAREKAGLPPNTGPYRVITPEAMFGFDEETHYMKLLAHSEWVTIKDVLDKMDFEPMVAPKLEILESPTEEELQVLRVNFDPNGTIIGEGKWINL
jgi:glutaconate CoA-transferase subunit B